MENNTEVSLEFGLGNKTLTAVLTPEELKERNVKELVKYLLDKDWRGEYLKIASIIKSRIGYYGDHSLNIAIRNDKTFIPLKHDQNLEKYIQNSHENKITLAVGIARGCPG